MTDIVRLLIQENRSSPLDIDQEEPIRLTVADSDGITINADGESAIPMEPDKEQLVPIHVEQVRTIWLNPDPYEGEYEFTPTGETQIVRTKHKTLDKNIVINPIPQNYGLVSYDGRIITIT